MCPITTLDDGAFVVVLDDEEFTIESEPQGPPGPPIYIEIPCPEVAGSFIASITSYGINESNQLYLIPSFVQSGFQVISGTVWDYSGPVINYRFLESTLGATGSVLKLVNTATNTSIAPSKFLTPQTPAFTSKKSDFAESGTQTNPSLATNRLGTIGIAGKPIINTAMTIATSNEYTVAQNPAGNLVQIIYDITGLKGTDTVVQVDGPGGRQDFDVPANAEGKADGTYATCQGNLLASRSGRLNATYPASFNKSMLTIVQVQLHFYYANVRLLTSQAAGGYSLSGGGDVQLFSDTTASTDYLTTPRTFDITSAVGGSWAILDTLQTYVSAQLGAAAVNDRVDVDAIHLEVISTLTQSL